jgi:hypothetical protein
MSDISVEQNIFKSVIQKWTHYKQYEIKNDSKSLANECLSFLYLKYIIYQINLFSMATWCAIPIHNLKEYNF